MQEKESHKAVDLSLQFIQNASLPPPPRESLPTPITVHIIYSSSDRKEKIPTYTYRWTWLQEMIASLQPALNIDTRLKT